MKLLKKREERLKSGMKIRWVTWTILWESYKVLGMRKLERGMVS